MSFCMEHLYHFECLDVCFPETGDSLDPDAHSQAFPVGYSIIQPED